MILITSLPTAEPVSSDSATDTSDTPGFWNRSSSSARSFTLRVSRSSLAMMTDVYLALLYEGGETTGASFAVQNET